MEAEGLTDPELRERLLALYWELAAYREVPRMLAELKAAGFATAILSNGSPDMLDGAVSSAGIGDYLDAVLSVEDVGVFKPDARVYEMVECEVRRRPGRGAVRLVQRLGRGGGSCIRFSHRLGQPRR